MPETTTTTTPQRQGLRTHFIETLMLAGPVIAGQIGHMLIGATDTMMIGALGSRYLAAASIANSLFFLIAVIGIGVCVALSALTAQALGAGWNKDALSTRLHQGMLVAFWIGLASMGILLGLAELIPYMQQQPETVPLAQSYLRILSYSLPFMMLFMAAKQFLDGFEAVIPGMVVMGFMVVFHVFFNWVMIHGHLGFPAMELDGAGWSTLVSRILGTAVMLGYVAWSPRFRVYLRWRTALRHEWTEIKEILKLGLPSGMQYFFEVGAFSGALLLAGRISKEAQSAHQIAIQLASVTYMFYMGFTAAASIRGGNAMGRRDAVDLRRSAQAAVLNGLVCVVVFVLLLVLGHEALPWLFIQEAPVVAIASQLLIMAAIFQVFDGIQAIVMGSLRGMNDVILPTAITFIAYWVIGLPGAWLCSEYLALGVEGIWVGLTLGLGFSALMLSGRLLLRLRNPKFPPPDEAGT